MISSSRRDCRCQTVHCGVTGTTKSTTCVFCGTVGSLSDEHVVAKWVRKALQIREPIREFSEAAYVGAAETLAIVFHEVCVSCNTGWMESLERDACPVLGPLLLGAAPGTSRVLDPDQQAILATWAVKTSLLLALSKFRGQDYGWIPASTLQWLYRHHDARMPLRHPSVASRLQHLRGSRVVQAACLYDASRPRNHQMALIHPECRWIAIVPVTRPGFSPSGLGIRRR